MHINYKHLWKESASFSDFFHRRVITSSSLGLLKNVLDSLGSAVFKGNASEVMECLEWFRFCFPTIDLDAVCWRLLICSPFLDFIQDVLVAGEFEALGYQNVLDCTIAVIRAAHFTTLKSRRILFRHPAIHSLSTLSSDPCFLLRVSIVGLQEPVFAQIAEFVNFHTLDLTIPSLEVSVSEVLSLFLAGQPMAEKEEPFFSASTWFVRRFVRWVSENGIGEGVLPPKEVQEFGAITCTAMLFLARDRTTSGADDLFSRFHPDKFATVVRAGFDALLYPQKVEIIDLFQKLLDRTWRDHEQRNIRAAFDCLCRPFIELGAEVGAGARKAVLSVFKRFMEFGIYIPEDGELFRPWLSSIEEVLVNVINEEDESEMVLSTPEMLEWDVATFVNGTPDKRRSFIEARSEAILGCCDRCDIAMNTVDELRCLEELVELFWSE